MRSWLHRLFCRHKKNHYCVNVSADGGDGILTIGGWSCNKCAAWRVNFVFWS